MIACLIFIGAANNFCSIEPDGANLRINTRQYLDQYEDYAGRSGDTGGKNNHPSTARFMLIDSLVAKGDKADSKSEPYNYQSNGNKWISKFFCEAKIGDVAIAFFTYCLVIVGGLQARRLRQTIATMEQTERPFMLVSELTVKGINSAPDNAGMVKLTIEYRMSNYGRSPAFLKTTFLNLVVVGTLPEPPNYANAQSVRFIVAVNGWYGSVAPSEVLIDGSEIREIFTGSRECFVWGRFEYSGIAPVPHKLRFAFRMIFDGQGNSSQFYPDGPDSYWENT